MKYKKPHSTKQLCPRCSKPFSCGIANGEETCWCFELPNVITVNKSSQCLCPQCLQEMIAEKEKHSKAE